MNLAEELIKQDEGLRLKAYKDTEGITTIGYGRNLEDRGISEEEADAFFKIDMDMSRLTLHKLLREYELIPTVGIQLINDVPFDTIRHAVLLNMSFNLGYNRLKGFKKMWAAIKEKDYEKAADEMLDSKWATQVGKRAIRLAHLMRTPV